MIGKATIGICRGLSIASGLRQATMVTLELLRENMVMIVHAETEDEIRIISLRAAEKDEQRLFLSNL